MKTWDFPTRLFKWSFAALTFAAPFTKWFGDATFLTHRLIGYTLLSLILWRVLWGLCGGELSRFTHFFPTPRSILTYLKNPQPTLGHNPIGSLMILTLLSLIFIQASLGLFSSDDVVTDGAFAYLFPDFMTKATYFHHKLFWLLVGFIALHIAANCYYHFVKKQPLIMSMVKGEITAQGQELMQGSLILALLLFALCLIIVFGSLYFFGKSAF